LHVHLRILFSALTLLAGWQ